MKRYRLLKDSPYVKAGAVFVRKIIRATEIMVLESPKEERPGLIIDKIMDFDEWFEEIKEPEQYYSINILKATVEEVMKTHYSKWAIENMKSIGILFETQEEAEEYLAYLKAKAIIKQDTKGFKPDWTNYDEKKYLGFWDIEKDSLDWLPRNIFIEATIYFKSREDIEESFKKHPEEWKTYLTYEQ